MIATKKRYKRKEYSEYIQGVSGGIVDILRAGSMDYSSFYLVYTGCIWMNSKYLGGGSMDCSE